MDSTDPSISFDSNGLCDYCKNYHETILPNWHTEEHGERRLLKTAEKIKRHGKGKDFD